MNATYSHRMLSLKQEDRDKEIIIKEKTKTEEKPNGKDYISIYRDGLDVNLRTE